MKDNSLFELDIERMEKDIKRVQKSLDRAEDIALKAAKKELISIVFDLLGEAMRKAPVQTGHLRGSGVAKVNDDQVGHTENTGQKQANLVNDFKSGKISLQKFIDELIGEVAFDTPYATYQHEEQNLNHPLGGESKYLETPLKQKSPQYIKGLADAIEEALEKKGV